MADSGACWTCRATSVLGGHRETLSVAEMLIAPQTERGQQKKINTENFSAQPSCSHCKADKIQPHPSDQVIL